MACEGRGSRSCARSSGCRRVALVVALVVVGSACASGQKMVPNAPIQKRSAGLGTNYQQHGKEVDRDSMIAQLEREPEAADELSGYGGFHGAALVTGAVGGALVGWPVGSAVAGNDNPPWVMAGVGAVLIVLAIPAAITADNKLESAVDAHNARLGRASEFAGLVPSPRPLPTTIAPILPPPPVEPGAYGDLSVRAVYLSRVADQPAEATQAEVVINGRPMGSTPFAASLPVGSYDVVVHHPDGQKFRRRLSIQRGDRQELQAEFHVPPTAEERKAIADARRARLRALAAEQSAQWAADHKAWQDDVARVDDDRTPWTTAAIITAGAGVALVGTGVFFGVKAKEADDDAHSAAGAWAMAASEKTRTTLEDRIAEHQSDRDTDVMLSASLLAGGGVALVTSAVLLIVRPGFPEEPIRPVVGNGELGVVIQGHL